MSEEIRNLSITTYGDKKHFDQISFLLFLDICMQDI